jgi:hypothetical protein
MIKSAKYHVGQTVATGSQNLKWTVRKVMFDLGNESFVYQLDCITEQAEMPFDEKDINNG